MTDPTTAPPSPATNDLVAVLDRNLPDGLVLEVTGGPSLAERLTRAGRVVVSLRTAVPQGAAPAVTDAPHLLADHRELPFATGSLAGAYVLDEAARPAGQAPARAHRELHRVVVPGGPFVLADGPAGPTEVRTAHGPASVRIRAMRTDEAVEVGRLTLRAYDRYGRIEGGYREFLADPLRRVDRCSAVLVAEVDADGRPQLAGTVSYVVPDDPEWEELARPAGDAGFRVLAVDPDHEGHGIGTALVDACVERAVEAGAHRLLIISMGWMHRAHELYQRRYGFERRPDLDVMFPNGLGVILTRDLSPAAVDRFPPPGPIPAEPPWYEDVMGRR